MRFFSSIFLCLCIISSVFAEDVVLVNGTVIDGSGKPRVLANVRIRDGKIVDVGPVKPVAGDTVLDVKGMIVAPGFIDLQTVSPAGITSDPSQQSIIAQGITTVVLGSDGTGPYSVEDFMLPFDEKAPAPNIAMLVGHGTVRKQIMGPDYKRAPKADELQRMRELVSDGMKQGAFGLGVDLQHEPGSFSTPDEVMALAKAVATLGGTVVMNLRNETDKVADSVKEAIAISRDGKVPVQVLTSSKIALVEIDKARTQRIDISADSYNFAQLVRDKTITLERAVQRMSATPSSRVGFRERGVLKKGTPADLVIFSSTTSASVIKYVFVNGVLTLKEGQPTDARAGQALR